MMHARNLTVAAAVLTLAAGTVVAANAGTDTSSTQLEEPNSLYAYAVQPDGCTPGYVAINHATGVEWAIGGEHVDVAAPASRITFPGGLQDDVTAAALDGYRIPGNVQSTFYVTINATPPSCTKAPGGGADEPTTEPVDDNPANQGTDPGTPGDVTTPGASDGGDKPAVDDDSTITETPAPTGCKVDA
jgi:hypothetical protein